VSSWQTIETAPKDGTEVLLFVPTLKRSIVLGHYVDTQEIEFGKEVRRRQCWNVGWQVFGDKEHVPTHWMPLPARP
jgi:hypothetical protein